MTSTKSTIKVLINDLTSLLEETFALIPMSSADPTKDRVYALRDEIERELAMLETKCILWRYAARALREEQREREERRRDQQT